MLEVMRYGLYIRILVSRKMKDGSWVAQVCRVA
jgi:hypothetical protein